MRSVLLAGLAAGTVFLILTLLLSAIIEGAAALGPPRIIGGLVMGQDASGLTTGFILVTVLGHFVLSLLFTYILSLIVYRFDRSRAALVGAVYGLGLYLLSFYIMSTAFPWFAAYRGTGTLLTHVGFGMTAALVFKLLHQPKTRSI